MSLGREIQDFLAAYTAVDHLATSAAKRKYYANKQNGNNPTAGQLASISPPGWLGTQQQAPGLIRRATDYLGITPRNPTSQSPGGMSGPMGAFGSGQMGPGGALSFAPVSAPPPSYDPEEFYETYERGGAVQGNALDYVRASQYAREARRDASIPPLPEPMQYDENGQPTGWGSTGQQDVDTSGMREPPIPMPGDGGGTLPPYEAYPGRDAVTAAIPAGASSPPPPRAALPVARAGNAPAAPAKRKALNDQTRTEAYDPELDGPTEALPLGRPNGGAAAAPSAATGAPVQLTTPQSGDMAGNQVAGLSTNNARTDLESAIDGGLRFAQRIFHLDGSNVAVGEDPHKAGGAKALMTGVGAATPDMVQAMDQRVNAGVPQGPNSQQIYAIRRLEAIYRWKSMNGDKAGADKAAFELLQFSAGVAAQFGSQAVQQYQQGDVQGAARSVQAGYNQIPDGRHMEVQGNTATIVDTRTGNVVEQIPITPQAVFNAAMGLSNRSLYWQVLAQRVSPQSKASNRTESQQDLDRARADYYRARTGQVGKGRAGGGGAAPATAPLIDRVNSLPRPNGATGGAAPTQPNALPPQGGGEEDPDEEPEGGKFTEAPPDLKEPPPPDSVVRLKRPAGARGPNPPPASAPAADGAPAPGPAAGGRQPAAQPVGTIASPPPDEEDPDAVPDREVMRNGDRYSTPAAIERATVEPAKPFSEPAPTGVPKELLDAQAEAAKLGRAGAAARQLISARIKEWQDYDKSYAARKKAFEAAEAKRVQQDTKKADADFKAATKQAQTDRREAAKEAHGYNLRPSDVQAIDDRVSDVYKDQAEKFPEVAKQLGDPVRVRSIAVDIAQRNKLSAEQAMRLVDKITTADSYAPDKRAYKAWGRDPLGNIVVTMEGAPPLHISPHIFKAITEVTKGRLGAITKKADEAKPKPNAREPISVGVRQVIENAKSDLAPLGPPYFGYDRSKYADPVTGRNPVNPAKLRPPRATPRVIE